MTDSILNELKILVERAVRPVRASTSRKRKMREELLAHVSGVFEVESAGLGDDRLALARTAQRFGDPAEVTSHLQETVPWIDRMAWLVVPPLWCRRPEESRWRFAVRQCLELSFFLLWTGTGGSILLLGITFLAIPEMRQSLVPARELPLLLGGAGIGLLVSIVVASAGIFLLHGMINALYERRGRLWPLILLLSGVASLIGVSFPLVLFGQGELGARTRASELLATLPFAAAIGPGLLIYMASVCRRMTDGSTSRSWRPIARIYLSGCAVVAGVTFAAAVALSGDVLLSVENTLKMIVVISSWVIPLELALCSPTIVGRIRSDQEWANIPIDPNNGAVF
jgi:hypothetical protein